MPRTARKISSTNIYHVVIRGIDRQILFNEVYDYKKYLEILEFYKEECSFDLFAYCLMSNHIHLLIKINSCPLFKTFHKINTRYATWFNMKYQRMGPLQQERFYSEPIEEKTTFLNALRYIHRNPTKAGLESFPGGEYQWSSIHEYMKDNSRLINISFVYTLITKQALIDFTNTENDDHFIDIDNIKHRIPDDVAMNIIKDVSKCNSCMEFQNINLLERKKYILAFHKMGISSRQINRLTGIPIGIIQRILSNS